VERNTLRLQYGKMLNSGETVSSVDRRQNEILVRERQFSNSVMSYVNAADKIKT